VSYDTRGGSILLAAQLYRRPSCSLILLKRAVTAIGLMPDNFAQLPEGWSSSSREAGRETRCSGNNLAQVLDRQDKYKEQK
jgi:hypothetical protein